MYKRIEELAEGKVHTAVPMLAFTPDQVRLEPVEGSQVTGAFTISSINKVPMKGVVYSTDLRMEIKNPQFQGEQVQIRYEFHGNYMQEGEVATGEFFIISNGGEYDLSWSVAVKRLYAETSIGRITNLEDYIRLYRANWRERVHVFSAPGFKKLLRSPNEALYYKLLSTKPVTRANMEEFLVACGRKERVAFALSGQAAEHLQLSEAVEESLNITLSDWGYTEIKVSCDADFISLEKELLTTDDFNGDHLQFRYQIYPERMHAGKNFARLTFSNLLILLLQSGMCWISSGKTDADWRRKTSECCGIMNNFWREAWSSVNGPNVRLHSCAGGVSGENSQIWMRSGVHMRFFVTGRIRRQHGYWMSTAIAAVQEMTESGHFSCICVRSRKRSSLFLTSCIRRSGRSIA